MSIYQEVVAEATKLSPAVAVISAHLSGMTIDDWIKWLTLLYLVCQIVFSTLKNRRDTKESSAKEKKAGNAE